MPKSLRPGLSDTPVVMTEAEESSRWLTWLAPAAKQDRASIFDRHRSHNPALIDPAEIILEPIQTAGLAPISSRMGGFLQNALRI